MFKVYSGKMNKAKRFFLIFLLFFTRLISCQELPPVVIYDERDYNAENQNWSISQSDNGFIYVANNKGLLEFNGGDWNLYETPNETIMRSVKTIDDKIFTGFYMDFGFWKKDKFGSLQFTSLVKKTKINLLEDEQIWEIENLDNYVLFKSLERIYIYNTENEKIEIINAGNRINKLSKIDDTFYFQEDKKGLFKIENGTAKLVSDNSILRENTIVDLFKNKEELLFLTKKRGFYTIKDSVVEEWKIPSQNLLKGKTIYSAKRLKDNGFALGSIGNGLICLDKNGGFNYQINQDSGLSNNTILSLFEDKQNNIWLGLDKGINCINNKSSFSIYKSRSEFSGTIYTSVLFNNTIYLGTNQGLFYRALNSNQPFQFVNNTQGQVWNLQVIDDTLFCNHDSGTYVIKGDKAISIFNKKGTWKLLKIDDNTILQGYYDGLSIIKKENNKWVFQNKIEGFDNSSKFIESIDSSTFLVNHEYKGVFKIEIDKNLTKIIKAEKLDSAEKGIHSSIVKYQNDLFYANKKGVFIYNKSEGVFKRDSIYSKLIDEDNFISARLIKDNKKNRLWIFTKDQIRYINPGKFSDKPEIKNITTSENIEKAASGYENILNLKNDVYLIGVTNGYLILDLQKKQNPKDFSVFINSVSNFSLNTPQQSLLIKKDTVLPFRKNNMSFSFSVPNFKKVYTTKYQYQLEGLNNHWSDYSSKNQVTFENIPFGDYTFKVRAKLADNLSDNIANYSFTIKRPFVLSNLMLVTYALVLCFAFYWLHFFTRRYYKKQKERYFEKLKKENELKELAISQQIIKLNNEKLRQDIDAKNKELATSTMNIIKKNEFLNTIKNELSEGGTNKVSKVVQIIDKNLNNSNDWNLFQEAFNNADKDFLKKVKEKHPNLTPNDLRLCAYLRLNLSSKEIAPLLNISPRSVEVKRYRLRKKMDLPHDFNLTNYILEI
jgi:ligand-binding sensor domain-containing protein/DNA-binding CsgD family transcriptional regulator